MGFGAIVNAKEICFNVWNSSNIGEETSKYIQLRLSVASNKAVDSKIQPWRSVDMVKGQLTFTSAFHAIACPAFAPMIRPELKANERETHLRLREPSKWDFNPRIGLKQPGDIHLIEMQQMHQVFKERYDQKELSFIDFCQAAFCLRGLVDAKLVHFKSDKNGDKATDDDWIVDDFIARWAIYEKFVDEFKLVECPSPVTWLIAELSNEYRLKKMLVPVSQISIPQYLHHVTFPCPEIGIANSSEQWRGCIGQGKIPLAEPVMPWTFLLSLEQHPKTPEKYPRLYSSEVRSIISSIQSPLLTSEEHSYPFRNAHHRHVWPSTSTAGHY